MAKWDDIYESVFRDIESHEGAAGSMVVIADRLGITRTAVSIALRKLKETKRLAVAEQGDFRKANTYAILEGRSSREIEDAEIDRLTLEGEL